MRKMMLMVMMIGDKISIKKGKIEIIWIWKLHFQLDSMIWEIKF